MEGAPQWRRDLPCRDSGKGAEHLRVVLGRHAGDGSQYKTRRTTDLLLRLHWVRHNVERYSVAEFAVKDVRKRRARRRTAAATLAIRLRFSEECAS